MTEALLRQQSNSKHFIIILRTTYHWFLPSTIWIQLTLSHPTSWCHFSSLSIHIQVYQVVYTGVVSPSKPCTHFSTLPCEPHAPPHCVISNLCFNLHHAQNVPFTIKGIYRTSLWVPADEKGQDRHLPLAFNMSTLRKKIRQYTLHIHYKMHSILTSKIQWSYHP